MQLTRLRLNGFKSFVDPTDLVISAGLTGVVGPNGCGKSNLLEALRWIMGETRAKQMRGSGMDDVIFAGTDSRQTRNSATVELVIDNSDRLAPVAFNTDDKLEISRRITREIGSAYRINGKDVRARDVQMLFADASTGAQSPSLVRQGQISELINAKPKARRRVLEEAAGISGLYQRRHEAELKLKGTETNLGRVDDVLEQLSSQLASLERQAGQARRYRRLSEELRQAEAVLLILRWQKAEAERAAAEGALTEAVRAVARAEAEVQAATRAREGAAEAVPAKREEETIAAAVLQRLTIERDQLDMQAERARKDLDEAAAQQRQLAADIEREEVLQRDAAASLAALADEAAALDRAMDGQDDAEAKAADRARAAAQALTRAETDLDRLAEEAARLAARVAAAERRVEEAEGNATRVAREIAVTEAALAKAADDIETTETALSDARDGAVAARSAAAAAETRLATAEEARAAAQDRAALGRSALSEAEGQAKALSAEVQGLERLLARGADKAGSLVDAITVEPGFEAALGAALEDGLSIGEARSAEHSGWQRLDAYATPATLPDGVRLLAEVVTAPAVLARRLSQTGVVEDGQGAAVQPALSPGQRIVTLDGALWRWDGLHLKAGDKPSAAALRLQQRNRLVALQRALDEAEAARAAAASEHAKAAETLEITANEEQEARTARRRTDQAVAEAARAESTAEAALDLARSRHASQTDILAARKGEEASVADVLAEAKAQQAGLEDPSAARAAVETQRGSVDLARTGMLSARASADEVRRKGAGRKKRAAEVERERAQWDKRGKTAGARIDDLRRRLDDAEARRASLSSVPAEVAERRGTVAAEIERADARCQAARGALTEAEATEARAEATEREAERSASAMREARARAEAILAGHVERVEAAAEAIMAAREVTPDALATTLTEAEVTLPEMRTAEADVARLTRQRDALGAVNLRADEDAEEVRAEHEALAAEKADLEAAIAKLRRGIAGLNSEGRTRLLEAFETVNKRFAELFRHLFGGGEARLIMVDSEDPLDAGLEILCQPPGKKLSTLSLLSGGEQTLTALSLIFAVFLSKPSPICVLDEVDAPLDDSNVTRFCDLLDEMRRLTETRFLIITHHAITMSRMDRLFGVTMVERGVSQLVSVDLSAAARMVES